MHRRRDHVNRGGLAVKRASRGLRASDRRKSIAGNWEIAARRRRQEAVDAGDAHAGAHSRWPPTRDAGWSSTIQATVYLDPMRMRPDSPCIMSIFMHATCQGSPGARKHYKHDDAATHLPGAPLNADSRAERIAGGCIGRGGEHASGNRPILLEHASVEFSSATST